MYPHGFNGIIECRLYNIFEPGVCVVWMMCKLFLNSTPGVCNSNFKKEILVSVLKFKNYRGGEGGGLEIV